LLGGRVAGSGLAGKGQHVPPFVPAFRPASSRPTSENAAWAHSDEKKRNAVWII
jgi:hypothetical protein